MSDDYESLPYRPCVGVMLVNAHGKVFVGKRIDSKEGDFTEFRHAKPRSFDVQKFQTMEDLKAVVEAQTGIPRANQAYFVRATIFCSEVNNGGCVLVCILLLEFYAVGSRGPRPVLI